MQSYVGMLHVWQMAVHMLKELLCLGLGERRGIEKWLWGMGFSLQT